MIRINLAPTNSRVTTGQAEDDALFMSQEEIQKQALKRLFLIAMFPAALFVLERQTIPDLQSKLSVLTAEYNSLSNENSASASLVEKIKKLNETKAVFDKRLQAIEKLGKNRYKEVKLLDFLQTTIPETVWFRSLDFNGDRISLMALAMSDADVTKFLEDLNRSGEIKEVKLNRSTDEKVEDTTIKRFEVDLVFETPSDGGQ